MSEFNEQDNIIEEETPVLHLELEDGAHLPRSRDERAELERDIIRELKQPNGSSSTFG